MGHHAHAAFLSLLREGNPDISEKIHAQSTQKPFTVSPLIGKMKKRGNLCHIKAGTECKLRFTFLDDELFSTLRESLLDIHNATHPLGRGNLSGETDDLKR